MEIYPLVYYLSCVLEAMSQIPRKIPVSVSYACKHRTGEMEANDFLSLVACLPGQNTEPKIYWKLFWNKRWRSIKEDIHLSSLWTHKCLSLPDVHMLPWTATTHKYILTLVSNSILNLGCILDSSSEVFKRLMSEHSFEPTGTGSLWESQGSCFKSSPVDFDV